MKYKERGFSSIAIPDAKSRNKRFSAMLLPFAVLFFFFIGCVQENGTQSVDNRTGSGSLLEGDNELLATVDGGGITRYDLERTIQTMFGPGRMTRFDEKMKRKVLESLVAGRAIAQAMEAKLDDAERAEIDKKLKAYREELLVQQYLEKFSQPQPVTQQMIKTYYESHPEQFGGKKVQRYEMIACTRELQPGEREGLLTALENPSEQTDWEKWTRRLQGKGYPLVFREGEATGENLDKRLLQVITPLAKGEASHVTVIDGNSYVVRVVDEKIFAPRPLEEVSSQIRKTLGPAQVAKAVKQASEQVLKSANVIYK